MSDLVSLSATAYDYIATMDVISALKAFFYLSSALVC